MREDTVYSALWCCRWWYVLLRACKTRLKIPCVVRYVKLKRIVLFLLSAYILLERTNVVFFQYFDTVWSILRVRILRRFTFSSCAYHTAHFEPRRNGWLMFLASIYLDLILCSQLNGYQCSATILMYVKYSTRVVYCIVSQAVAKWIITFDWKSITTKLIIPAKWFLNTIHFVVIRNFLLTNNIGHAETVRRRHLWFCDTSRTLP